MPATGDEAAIALVGLAHVEQLNLTRREPPLQLVDRHGLHLRRPACLHPAFDLEDPDRPEALRGIGGVTLVFGVDHDRAVGKDECRLRPERRAAHGNVDRTRFVPFRERVRVADVERGVA